MPHAEIKPEMALGKPDLYRELRVANYKDCTMRTHRHEVYYMI